MRATGSDVNNAGALQGVLARMGKPLYQCQTPNGYPMTANLWLDSDALVDRLNFAMSLTSGKVPGVKFDAPRVLALGVLTRTPMEKSMPPMSADGSQAVVTLLEKTLRPVSLNRFRVINRFSMLIRRTLLLFTLTEKQMACAAAGVDYGL